MSYERTPRLGPEARTRCLAQLSMIGMRHITEQHEPEVADLDIQLGHAGVDFLSRSGLAVQRKRRCLLVAMEHAADD